jgi:hypothetical protein
LDGVFLLAGRPGLEPRMTEPESVVLPLNYLPSDKGILQEMEKGVKAERLLDFIYDLHKIKFR